MKLLLAEDEEDLAEVVAEMLRVSGYEVDAVENGKEAVEKATTNAYDAMIFDIMMPVMDGITAVKEIRRMGDHTPALFLTAKTEVNDRIEGLDAGADDYLTKPFAMGELLARVRAMTRRHRDYEPKVITLGNLTLDVGKGELKCRNSISLALRECRMMEHFMTNPGVEFSTEELLEKFWEDDEAEKEAVWMYVSFLRNKLQAVGGDRQIVGERGGSFSITE